MTDFADKQRNGVYKVSLNLLNQRQDIKAALEMDFTNGVKEVMVSSAQFKAIIVHFTKDMKLRELVEKVRSVEEKVRNLAAHQIVSVTEDFIKNKTGFAVSQIVSMLKDLIRFSGVNVKEEDWKAYDRMNEKLKELVKEFLE